MQYQKISIITPSYNQGEFLEETIKSVLDQNYPNLEYIIMDGGSTDNSVDIIKKYQNRLKYWESKKDQGQSHAINKGFRRATGDIIGWLNSDDLYLPDTLQTVVRFFRQHPDIDMVYGDQIEIDASGQVIRAVRSSNFNRRALIANGISISQPTSFYRRKVFEGVGDLDENIHWNMDFEYVLRIAFNGYRIFYIKQPLAKFRLHSTSKTVTGTSGERNHRRLMNQIQKKYLAQYPYRNIKLICRLFRIKRIFFNLDRIFKYRGYYMKRILNLFRMILNFSRTERRT